MTSKRSVLFPFVFTQFAGVERGIYKVLQGELARTLWSDVEIVEGQWWNIFRRQRRKCAVKKCRNVRAVNMGGLCGGRSAFVDLRDCVTSSARRLSTIEATRRHGHEREECA